MGTFEKGLLLPPERLSLKIPLNAESNTGERNNTKNPIYNSIFFNSTTPATKAPFLKIKLPQTFCFENCKPSSPFFRSSSGFLANPKYLTWL